MSDPTQQGDERAADVEGCSEAYPKSSQPDQIQDKPTEVTENNAVPATPNEGSDVNKPKREMTETEMKDWFISKYLDQMEAEYDRVQTGANRGASSSKELTDKKAEEPEKAGCSLGNQVGADQVPVMKTELEGKVVAPGQVGSELNNAGIGANTSGYPVNQQQLMAAAVAGHLPRRGGRAHACTVCTKAFKSPCQLRTHMRTHTGEKPYSCTFCKKSFSQSSYLTVHTRIHTGDKPYRCYICSKSFVASNKLTLHIRTHTGEKPYKCLICSKSFTQSSSLKKHTWTHTGVKPYNHAMFSKSCTQLGNLSRQIAAHLMSMSQMEPSTVQK